MKTAWTKAECRPIHAYARRVYQGDLSTDLMVMQFGESFSASSKEFPDFQMMGNNMEAVLRAATEALKGRLLAKAELGKL